jgi:hypothetical protein
MPVRNSSVHSEFNLIDNATSVRQIMQPTFGRRRAMGEQMFRFVTSLFGCAHTRCTFPMTATKPCPSPSEGKPSTTTYVVCLKCGKEFAYDWAQMKRVTTAKYGVSISTAANIVKGKTWKTAMSPPTLQRDRNVRVVFPFPAVSARHPKMLPISAVFR